MKQRQVFQLGAFAIGVLVSAMAWMKLSGAVVISWLVVVAPLIVIGGFEILHGSAVVIVSLLLLGSIVVDRADAAAKKGKTIRKGRRK